MISIIVCSVNNTLFENFEKSLSQTIGVPYEIIRIENLNNRYSICQAYNLGALRAKYNYLCFAHEDILFHTKNWGELLITTFQNANKAGLIGIAGSKYKSLSPSGWMTGISDLDYYNLYQHYSEAQESSLEYNNPEIANNLVEVKTLDGVLLFTERNIWETNKFDENTFTGFHCYDLDFCLQVGREHKLYVCFEIVIEHLSSGSSKKEWIENAILLSNKWRTFLPVGEIKSNRKKDIEWKQKRFFFLKMRIYKFPLMKRAQILFDYGYFKYFNLEGNRLFLIEVLRNIRRKFFKYN